jgi:hypothetical protein
MFAEPQTCALEKREKSLRAPDQCHPLVERRWFPHLSRIKLTNEPTTRLWTFRVDGAVVICVALHERRTRLLERLAVRDHEQTMPPCRLYLA